MLKLKLQYIGHLMQRHDSLKKILMLERLKAGGEGYDRGWGGWMASPTHWTWVWVNSRSWWWTEAWLAAVHGVAKSWTRLSDWTELIFIITIKLSLMFVFMFEEGMATHSSTLTWGIPMDRGAWRAAVYGVTKSQTWLGDWSQHSTVLCLTDYIFPLYSQGLCFWLIIFRQCTFYVLFNKKYMIGIHLKVSCWFHTEWQLGGEGSTLLGHLVFSILNSLIYCHYLPVLQTKNL